MISIGVLANQAGVKVPTIRYYEQIGLLDAPPTPTGSSAATAPKRCVG
jgi:DNA-binding transcriptional MerR regulator